MSVKTYDNELAEVFAMLHPSMMPALRHQFEDFKRDAQDDQMPEHVARADRAIEAIDLVIAENEASEATRQ